MQWFCPSFSYYLCWWDLKETTLTPTPESLCAIGVLAVQLQNLTNNTRLVLKDVLAYRLFQKEIKVFIFCSYTILSRVRKLDCNQKKVDAFDVHCVWYSEQIKSFLSCWFLISCWKTMFSSDVGVILQCWSWSMIFEVYIEIYVFLNWWS